MLWRRWEELHPQGWLGGGVQPSPFPAHATSFYYIKFNLAQTTVALLARSGGEDKQINSVDFCFPDGITNISWSCFVVCHILDFTLEAAFRILGYSPTPDPINSKKFISYWMHEF